MNVPFCDVSIDSVENKEELMTGITDILQRSDFISGKSVQQFEDAFATYIGTKHCVGVANGTDALEIAIESLRLEADSRILVQGNSYIATALAALNQRTHYVLDLVDVNKETNMIDVEDLQTKATNTKLLIVTHLFGYMSNMEQITNFCKENNIFLIEDCAQAHGASWNDKKAGSFGILSCFSFYPTKNLGAFGDGGAIVTNDTTLYNWIKRRANMGSIIKNEFEIIGRNSRLDTIQAHVLYHKLHHLDKNNQKRRLIATIYKSLLRSVSEVKMVEYDPQCNPVYHLFVIRVPRRDELQDYLKKHGITTLVHYPTCIGKTEAFANILQASTPHCEELSNEILSLPMYPTLLDDLTKIQYVADIIKEFYHYSSSVPSPLVTRFYTKEAEGKKGKLHAVNHLPTFECKRMFYIDGFEDATLPVERGNHCNVNTTEYVTVLDGAIFLEIEYNNGIKESIMLLKNDSIYIPNNTWIRYTILHPNTRLVVLCDTTFEEQITESDYESFKGISSSSRNS